MEPERSNTYQPNGYIKDEPHKSIEMRNYNEPRNTETYHREEKQRSDLENAKEFSQEEQSMKGYLLHWVAFCIAIGVNIGVWAVDYYAVKRQYSYYYYNYTTFSPYIDTVVYANSNLMFTPEDPFDTVGVVVAIVYSWVLWKGPLAVFVLHLSSHQESKGLRFGTWAAEVLVLLATDVLLTIFAKSFYSELIFYGVYLLVTLIVALIANSGLSRAK